MPRFLFALAAFLSLAVSSFAQLVKLPETVTGLPGQWIVVPIEVDGGAAKIRLPDGLAEVNLAAIFPDEMLSKLKGRVVSASKAGRYKFEAWNAKANVASDISTCIVIVGDAPPTIPPVDPGKPPVTSGKYFFFIVRPNGSGKQEYVAYMGNPGWDELRKAGHAVKDYTVDEAAAYGIRFGTVPGQSGVDVPFGTPLPLILTLTTDGGKSKIVRGAVALPDPANIIHLPEGIK